MKGQGIADQLSKAPTGRFEPLETYFPDKGIMAIQRTNREDKGQFWKMYFDDTLNMEGAGAVLVSITEKQYPVTAKLQFSNSNNIAEYE